MVFPYTSNPKYVKIIHILWLYHEKYCEIGCVATLLIQDEYERQANR